MPKYEETWDVCNRICPYCGESYQVESEDYSEDTHEEECDDCGKKYYGHENFSVSCIAKPDCVLNGDDHIWEPIPVKGGTHDFCSICGECRTF